MDKDITITELYKKEVKRQRKDVQALLTATDYTKSYIKHGSACDSSDRAEHRMKYVKQAEKEFIEDNKIKILNRAAKLCEKDI